ncbi:MAG: hypothetical protein M1826_004961 [Phylliscum demangeonii]|nr:MAG: hypothetical protein M1826_004961 [Phylliscum demangeonii]
MAKSIKCLLLAALSLSRGNFGTPISAPTITTSTATFDDLDGQGTGNLVPVPYQSLRFGTFGVRATKPALDGLPPHSAPNYAISDVAVQTQESQLPTIDIKYPGSTVKSFDLHSLYFGCTIVTLASSTAVTGCTVRVTGTKAATGATVGPELINFAPPSLAGTGLAPSSSFAFASFSDLTGLASVTLEVVLTALPAGQDQTTALYLDDVVHTNYV